MKKYTDNFKLLLGIIVCSSRAKSLYEVSFRWCLQRGLSLVKKHRFTPEESLQWGLYDPALNEDDLSGFVSKRSFNIIQNQINPLACYYLTEDKAIFYRMCQSCGLPVPELFAIIYNGFSSWTREGKRLVGVNDWIDFLKNNNLGDFVIKPSRSVYGRDVVIVKYTNDLYALSTGKNYTIDELAKYMHNINEKNGMIMQEVLCNNLRFELFNCSKFLQTIRLMTYVDNKGHITIISAFLKGIRGQNITDNFEGGRSGNFVVSLDVASGRPVEVVEGHNNKATVMRSSWIDFCLNHEESHLDFIVPLWNEVCTLGKQAAEAFQPLRSVGWDIAVTPSGPVLLEGNYRAGTFPTTSLKPLLQPIFDDFAEKQRNELNKSRVNAR